MNRYQVYTHYLHPVIQLNAATAEDALRIAKQKGIWAPIVELLESPTEAW